MAQYVVMEQTWEDSKFHCPACGALVCTGEEISEKPCKHVLFSWINEVGEFENLDPSLKDLVESEDFIAPSDEEFLNKCPDTAVLFAFDIHQMACGPITTTVVHGIDFAR
jgi:hypothetical protein